MSRNIVDDAMMIRTICLRVGDGGREAVACAEVLALSILNFSHYQTQKYLLHKLLFHTLYQLLETAGNLKGQTLFLW